MSQFTYRVADALEFEVSYSVKEHAGGERCQPSEREIIIDEITNPDSGDSVIEDVLTMLVIRNDKPVAMIKDMQDQASDDYDENGE